MENKGRGGELPTKPRGKRSYLQASNANPPPRPKLQSESDPLSVCFPKPLVTPAKDTQSEPECRHPRPLTHTAVCEPPREGAARRGGENGCAFPTENGSWVVESGTGLGEMLAEALSRHCIFLPFLWFYCKKNTAHSSLQLLSSGYKGKYQASPLWQDHKSLGSASHFKPQLSGSLLCLLGSPPAWPLQINTHTPYPLHSWQQRASFFWDGVRGG